MVTILKSDNADTYFTRGNFLYNKNEKAIIFAYKMMNPYFFTKFSNYLFIVFSIAFSTFSLYVYFCELYYDNWELLTIISFSATIFALARYLKLRKMIKCYGNPVAVHKDSVKMYISTDDFGLISIFLTFSSSFFVFYLINFKFAFFGIVSFISLIPVFFTVSDMVQTISYNKK